ncbi:CBS domain-containing protein [Candidatus Woesearchaeota archaeon]|nr:CBS domain-containing protein [Candidatus Woesearchaeota archaeon]
MADRITMKTIMSKKVVSVSPEDYIMEIAAKMRRRKIGTVIVLDKEKLVGMLTERDIIGRVVAKGLHPTRIKAKDIMEKKVITGTPDMTDIEAASLFAKRKIKKLPILEKGKVVGIVTQTDIMKLLSFKWAL